MSFHVLRGDARHLPLADASVQCVVTSPPYWNLRNYNVSGQLGLEPTPEEYVQAMVGVFREVWRVLRPDGTAWLNLGDSYAGSNASQGGDGSSATYSDGRKTLAGAMARQVQRTSQKTVTKGGPGLKPKDLVGIPWRVAFALQADGWYLRSEIIWHKPNPMPESVTDRPTKAHEQVFLLSKAPRYYYDAEAVKEENSPTGMPYGASNSTKQIETRAAQGEKLGKTSALAGASFERRQWYATNGRNRRTVWTIATQPFSGSHFAVMPPDLAETCIKAGTSEKGCCPTCGAPWERVVEKERTFESGSGRAGNLPSGKNGSRLQGGGETGDIRRGPCVHSSTLGFRPTCACPEREPTPCVVLDPFSGAGTTMLVADRLNRRGVGVELSADYARMAYNRCYQDAPLLAFAQEALP